MDYLKSLFDANFLPHGHCFRWTTDIFWLHLLGDVVTATAYYLIPGALGYFIWKRKHLPYPLLFALFGVFILACGTTHILGVVTLWHPVYRLEGWVKGLTALASIGTAVVLYPIIPKALRLRTPEELEALNRELEAKNRELDAGRESFRNIVERNQEGILVLDEAGTVVFANQAACGYLDCGEEGPVGTPFRHPLEEGSITGLDVPGREEGAPGKSAEMWVSDTQWEGRPARLVHLRDVTYRKRAEEALRQSREQLQQAQKMEAIGRLAGGIAHDFNNLLTAINGFTSLALARLPEGSPVREELVEVAKAGERATQLTGQLLAFSRKQILSPRRLDLNKAVMDIGAMIRRIIGEDVILATRLDGNLPDIRMDPGQLEQIILNLAVNARDAMPEGGELLLETRKVRIEEGGDRGIRPGGYALLAVSDKGTGMTAEVRERLFEPFFTTKGPGRGTGLGLSTVYGIVQQSEGHIEVKSAPGKGTTFEIWIPLAEEGLEAQEKPAEPAQVRTGTETILLVEDEGPVRRLVSELLRGAGYTVIQADDGQTALEKARGFAGTIHLLLTDVVMRNMGGSLLSRTLLRSRPGTRVLFMSGYTDDAVVHLGILDASLAFIQKPFSPSQLLARVREALDAPPGPANAPSSPLPAPPDPEA